MKRKTGMCHILMDITYMLIFTLLLVPLPARAQDNAGREKVKVGWYNSDHFQEGSAETDIKSGYSYEYLQSIANYTGWDYEYVYGGWGDLYDALILGDIDLLAGVSYTEDRAGLMNYPGHEMGYESYYIYKKAGDDRITGSDLASLDGMKVGTLKNNLMTTYFEIWMEEMQVHCEEVMFNDFDSRDQAFEDGEIDAFIAVNNNIPSNSGYSPVVMVGKSSYYMAVSAKRADLLDELNATLEFINESDPYFTDNLQIKYFQNTAVNAALSTAENEWIKEHGKIRVGYIDNYMPFCGTDENGNVTGVVTDIISMWKNQLGLTEKVKIEYIPFQTYSEMTDALQDEGIDVAFPISDSIWLSEQQGIVQTRNLIESSVYLIYKGEYTDDSARIIAYSEHSPFQKNYAVMNYPDSELYMAENAVGCLDAVKNGEATCTFFNSGRAEEFLSTSEYDGLNRLPLGENVNCCLGVKKGNNIVYSLIQRGVCLTDKSTMTNEMYKYANFGTTYSLTDFMSDNVMVVVTVAAVIIGLIVCIALILAVTLRKTREQNRKEQEMLQITKKQKEELEIAKDHLQDAVAKAERASQAKTNFLFNMSHDIRTPMNAILGFADLAASSDDHKQVEDYIKKIKDAGDVLLSILNNVLEMSRIEKGTISLEEEACEIEKFNKSLFTMFDAQMEQKKISFSRKSIIKNPYIYCDVIKMREIFMNILSNAYKYTDEGGSVDMIIEELPSQKEGSVTLRTTISDTGRGMSEDYLPTLFEEFSRERISEGNRIEGTGLGMAIVKSFVELMGGTIDVKSKLGEGTTFVVTTTHRIAAKEDVKGIVNKENAKKVSFAGKRLLLAEDMDVNAQIARAILKKSGFEVDRAENGQVCVDMIKEKPANYYDAILMDIQMPKLNGYEATRQIRSLNEPGKSDIPIIAMTANTFEEDRKNAREAGMDAHVGKPIVVDDLMGNLQKFLEV